MQVDIAKPVCKIDSGAWLFQIMYQVTTVLKSSGQYRESELFIKRANSAGSFQRVLEIAKEYVEVI